MEITGEQFNKLATKNELRDLKEDVGILKQEQRELRDEVRPLREELTKFKDEVLTGQDKIIRQLKIIRQEQAAFTGGQERQNEKLEEHDKRLEQVEVKIGIEPITTYDGDG